MSLGKYIKALFIPVMNINNENCEYESIRSKCINSLSNILQNLILKYKEWENIEYLKSSIKNVIFELHCNEKDRNLIITSFQGRLERIVDILQSSDNFDEEFKEELLSQINLLKKDKQEEINIEETIREIKMQSREMGNIYYTLAERDKNEINRVAERYKNSFYQKNFTLDQLVYMSSGFFLCLLNMDIKYLTPNQIAACKGILQELVRKQGEKDRVIYHYLHTVNPKIDIMSLVNDDCNFLDHKWLDLENANL